MPEQPGCSVHGCSNPHSAKGLCKVHYDRVHHSGSPLTLAEQGKLKSQQRCIVEGCEGFQKGRGYCEKHYSRLLRAGGVFGTSCSCVGCIRNAYSKGLCENHYRAQLLSSPEYIAAHPCSAPRCDRASRYKGMCQKHRKRVLVQGHPGEPVETDEQAARRKRPRGATTELGTLCPLRDWRPGRAGYFAVNVVSEIRSGALVRRRRGSKIAQRRPPEWWRLTAVEAYHLITAPCFYCGAEAGWPDGRNGIDRVDSDVGYTPANCVTACFRCNAAKNDGTVDEFRAWADRLHAHLHRPAEAPPQPKP